MAAGLSDFFGIDATLIRVLFVLSIFFSGGVGALIYLLCWVLIPAGGPRSAIPRRGLAWLAAVAALTLGTVMAANDNRTWIIAALVVVGALMVWRRVRGRKSWKAHKEFEKARLAWQRRLDEQARMPPTTYLGGDPFRINSFFPEVPPQANPYNNPNPDQNSGFQIQ